MAFCFQDGDRSLEEGLRRIALEQIDSAIQSLARAGQDASESIHDVRKRCKRLRGVVRLVHASLPGYRDEDKWFRDTARLFGGLRDRKVFFKTFDTLARKEKIAAPTANAARAFLSREWDLDHAGLSGANPLKLAHERLTEARRRAKDWELREQGWEAACDGLHRTYRSARRAMRHAAREPSGENHHAWRGHVEIHWFHACLLEHRWPAMAKRVEPASRLADLLGDHHDLFVFEQRASALPAHLAARAPLAGLARVRREVLEGKVHGLGARLFRDPARRWRHRCEDRCGTDRAATDL